MKSVMKKGICLLVCAALCLCFTTGCSGLVQDLLGLGGFSASAAADLVQGNLDVIYLNEYTDAYLNSVDMTAAQADQEYATGIATEVEYFAYYFDIVLDSCDSSIESQITELYHQIYDHSKYEIGSATKNDDTYLVELTIYPIDIFQKAIEEDGEAMQAAWQEQVNSGAFDSSDESVFETAWAQMIIDMVSGHLDSIGYLDPETITVQVVPDSEGVYSISQNDFERIDTLIISY